MADGSCADGKAAIREAANSAAAISAAAISSHRAVTPRSARGALSGLVENHAAPDAAVGPRAGEWRDREECEAGARGRRDDRRHSQKRAARAATGAVDPFLRRARDRVV